MTGERQYGQGGAVRFPVRGLAFQRMEMKHSVQSAWLQHLLTFRLG